MAKKIKLLDFIPGYSCNSGCIYCSIDEKIRKINLNSNKASKLLDEALNVYSPTEIRFGGGEPTIRKDIIQLIEIAKRHHIKKISLQTNGYLLFYEDFLDRLVKGGLNKVRLSLRSINDNEYRSITNVDKSFQYVNIAIDNILKKKLELIVDIVVTNNIISQLNEITNYIISKHIASVNYWALWISGRALDNIKYLSYRYSEVIPILRDLIDKHKKNLRIKLMYFPFCLLGVRYSSYYWNPFDEDCVVVTPMETFRLDNERFMNLTRFGVCKRCKFINLCIGVSKNYLDLYGDGEFNQINIIK